MEQILVEEEGIRIDRYLAKQKPELSRSMIQKLIEDHAILVNQKPVRTSYQIRKQDQITIQIPEVFSDFILSFLRPNPDERPDSNSILQKLEEISKKLDENSGFPINQSLFSDYKNKINII